MSTTHDEVVELLGAFALDAVGADEAALVEDHLRECPRCRAEVAEHRETAALLAHAGADAPPEIWSRIAGSIDAPAPAVPMVRRLGGSRVPRIARSTALVAAAAAIVIVALGFQVREQGQRIDDLATELAAGDAGFTRAMAERDTTMVELAGLEDGYVPVAVTADGRAWLLATDLPALDEGRTYQLWGAAGEELVSIAVLGRDPGVISFDVTGYALLAITEEAAPGVVTSANPPIVAGEVS